MKYPFRMSGQTVEVYRYQVDYTETSPAGEPEARTSYLLTLEEAQAVAEQTGGTITSLDVSIYEWMDGLIMPDVPDTYGEAVKVYQMGKAEYRRKLAFETAKRSEQIRADLDYVMLMGGLT